MNKICIKCGESLEINSTNFNKHRTCKDGFEGVCKKCKNIHRINYLKNNKEERYKKCREWNKNNKERLKQTTESWIKENPKRAKEIKTKSIKKFYSNPKNIEKRRENNKEYMRMKRKNNVEYKIKDSVASTLNFHLKKGKTLSSIKYLGCSIEYYKQYLESKFLPEMNWDNYGKMWEIDHILPISSFNLNETGNIFKVFHYTNTQPLFKTTSISISLGYNNHIGNRNKNNKIIQNVINNPEIIL